MWVLAGDGFSSPAYPANRSLHFRRQPMHGLPDRPFPDQWPYTGGLDGFA
jgi:hypothetical protein